MGFFTFWCLMIIYFRACEKQETISYVDRYKYDSKTKILKKCWLSLQSGISEDDKIIIIADAVSESTIQFLIDTSNTKNIEIILVPKHAWEHHLHTVVLVDTLEKYSNQFPNELHYIVEDDYLHVPNAISILKDNLKDCPYFALSYDYPDRYVKPELAMIIIGSDRHWRTVSSSTMTVLALGETWLKVIPALKQAAPTSNDKVFEAIYQNIACISPIPALSSHMTKYHLSPLIDWETIYENISTEDY